MSQINVDDILPFSGDGVRVSNLFLDLDDSLSSMKLAYDGNPVRGINNTYIGWGAGASINNASNGNTILGKQAGTSVTSGSSNVLIGSASGQLIQTGVENVCIGTQSGVNTTASQNIFIGHNAGFTATTGSNNVVLGYQSNTPSATTSNSITLGNSSSNVLRCAVTSITSLSDARDKKDVAPIELGLDFVKELNPVKFVWNDRDEEGKHDIADSGFIAQELKAVEDKYDVADVLKLVYDENPDRLEASYGRLIPVLVQAIKDLAAKVEQLESK